MLPLAWLKTRDAKIQLQGLDLDKAWENIITQIGEITIEEGRSLDEQIEYNEKRLKAEKEIAKFERWGRYNG